MSMGTDSGYKSLMIGARCHQSLLKPAEKIAISGRTRRIHFPENIETKRIDAITHLSFSTFVEVVIFPWPETDPNFGIRGLLLIRKIWITDDTTIKHDVCRS